LSNAEVIHLLQLAHTLDDHIYTGLQLYGASIVDCSTDQSVTDLLQFYLGPELHLKQYKEAIPSIQSQLLTRENPTRGRHNNLFYLLTSISLAPDATMPTPESIEINAT
jgi:hypothetical protein